MKYKMKEIDVSCNNAHIRIPFFARSFKSKDCLDLINDAFSEEIKNNKLTVENHEKGNESIIQLNGGLRLDNVPVRELTIIYHPLFSTNEVIYDIKAKVLSPFGRQVVDNFYFHQMSDNTAEYLLQDPVTVSNLDEKLTRELLCAHYINALKLYQYMDKQFSIHIVNFMVIVPNYSQIADTDSIFVIERDYFKIKPFKLSLTDADYDKLTPLGNGVFKYKHISFLGTKEGYAIKEVLFYQEPDTSDCNWSKITIQLDTTQTASEITKFLEMFFYYSKRTSDNSLCTNKQKIEVSDDGLITITPLMK